MIDRAEVEALLATVEQIHKPNKGVIAELCRVYLAWLDAPVVGTVQTCPKKDGMTWVAAEIRQVIVLDHSLVTDAEGK